MCGRGSEDPVDLTGDVSLEAADDLLLGLALGCTLGDVGSGPLIAAHAADGDHVECPVGMSVQTMADTLARGRRYGCGPAQVGKGSLALEALGVVSSSDQ